MACVNCWKCVLIEKVTVLRNNVNYLCYEVARKCFKKAVLISVAHMCCVNMAVYSQKKFL
jgi:hypothetical protein